VPWYLARGFRGPQSTRFAYVRADGSLPAGWTLDGPDGATAFADEPTVLRFAADHAIGYSMARPCVFGSHPPPAGRTPL
jgi:hypothetical protein